MHYTCRQNMTKRIVILSHGYRGSRFGTLSFMAKYLHEHQCDVLFIEHRCCGDSEGKYITFGAKEQWDVQQWAVYVSERNKEKLPIYLYDSPWGSCCTDGIRTYAPGGGKRPDRGLRFSVYGRTDARYGS